MTQINLPYTLSEGSIAYASKVMGNLNAILTALNNLSASGVGTSDIQTIITGLAALIDANVTAGETGNADEIKFSDGDTMQAKLDAGDLNGTDGVTAYVDGWGAFEVNEDGHLLVTVSAEENPFSIDENGELIFTVPAPGGGDTTTYDLGNVQGIAGNNGEVTTAAMESYVAAQIAALAASSVVAGTALAAGNYVANNASWDDRSAEATYKQAKIPCAGITATNNFIVKPAISATSDECALWAAANPRVISQGTDYFTLEALGTLPDADIPLQVVINV